MKTEGRGGEGTIGLFMCRYCRHVAMQPSRKDLHMGGPPIQGGSTHPRIGGPPRSTSPRKGGPRVHLSYIGRVDWGVVNYSELQ